MLASNYIYLSSKCKSMDAYKELMASIRERIKNLLIYSFLFAWCIYNWRTLLVLFFYSSEDVLADGYGSKLDAIDNLLSGTTSLWYPLVSALLFTFFFPLIRNTIGVFNAWMTRWGTDWNLKIARKGYMPTEKFMKMKQELTEQINAAQQLVEDEKKLELTINQKNDLIASLQRSVDLEREKTSFSKLHGMWSVSEKRNIPYVIKVDEDGSIVKRVINNKQQTHWEAFVRITEVRESEDRRSIFFKIKETETSIQKAHICELKINPNDKDQLIGLFIHQEVAWSRIEKVLSDQ